MIELGIEGIQQTQDANLRDIATIRLGALGNAVRAALVVGHRYVVAITHVDTGALRAAHRMEIREWPGGAQGQIYIDPAAINPRGQRPAVYGIEEHDRGGEHAFYDRTFAEAGMSMENAAVDAFLRSL